MLTAAVAKHLASLDLLTFDAEGVTGDTFIDTMPSAPDVAVAISGTGGQPTNSHDGYDMPVLQVRVRGEKHDPRPPYLRARAIYGALVGLHAVTLDDDGDDEVRVIRTVALQSDPAPIGVDDNDRHEFVINFAFTVRALTEHRV
jgi:hypothetical protein